MISHEGFVARNLVRIAAAGMAAVAAAGCANNAEHISAEHTQPTASAPANKPPASPAPEAAPDSNNPYDIAYDFVAKFNPRTVNGPVHVPAGITDEGVRTLTLRVAELNIAKAVVSESDDSDAKTDQASLAAVNALQQQDIRARAITGIVNYTYADILSSLINGPASSDIQAETSFLEALLGKSSKEYERTAGDIARLTQVSAEAKQQYEAGNTSAWSENHNILLGATAAARTAAAKYWSGLNAAAATAELNIQNNSPKAVAQRTLGTRSYADYLHQCIALPALQQDICEANEAIRQAGNDSIVLFEVWEQKVDGPAEQLRMQQAAADRAISDIENGHDATAKKWAAKVHNAADIARINQARALHAPAGTS